MSNIRDDNFGTIARSHSGPRLVAQQGPERGRTYAIPPTGLLVGRAGECDLTLDDVQVSRRHARLYWHGSRLLIEDLGSANGTLVNGGPVSGPQPLSEQDLLNIGNSVFLVQGLISRELTPTARNLDAAVSPRYAPPPQAVSQQGSSFWLVLTGLALALLLAVLVLGALWYFSRTPAAVSQVPTVTVLTPMNGAQVTLNVPVIVQASATDNRGVTRMELWADGALVSQQASPSPQGASPLLLNLTWTPTSPGSHVLEVRAFNSANQSSTPVQVTVNAVAGTPTATSIAVLVETPTPVPLATATATAVPIIIFTSTPSPTPVPPPTEVAQPGLQAVADVNVRGGPGTNYPILGLLRAGQVAPVVGRSADGGWWQILFPPNTGGTGWVAGNFVQTNAAAGAVPVVAAPPSPPTPAPPPTNTPPPSAEISFTADSTELNQGQCTRLRWRVKNVAAYFVDGVAGAGDEGEREVCDPVGPNTHTLRVQKRDGSTQDFTVTINVRATTVPRPSLISPDDDENFDEGDEVDFDWSEVSAPGTITYNIEIQSEDDGEWENWRTVTGLEGTRYVMGEFAGNRPGRWRVWATSSTLGDSEKTEWREFEFED
ncbi:MAG: FHA domain-containing protein [Anaerolineales bacterium]|nr:FHA domain-containing protein [Anaerolineales bacterium]